MYIYMYIYKYTSWRGHAKEGQLANERNGSADTSMPANGVVGALRKGQVHPNPSSRPAKGVGALRKGAVSRATCRRLEAAGGRESSSSRLPTVD